MATYHYDISKHDNETGISSGTVLQKNVFTVVCRGSWLSLAQANIFAKRVQQFFPAVHIQVIIRETAGDKNQSTPLHLVEGKDFFTKAIQQSLHNGEADFALHSMKDVSSQDFFSNSCYAVINRDILQDVAVFNKNIVEKISNGQTIIIGTSSPRRSHMAVHFLQKALPVCNGNTAVIKATPVRGNVDVRLQKLSNGECDGLILAGAGLNRLLGFEPSRETVLQLLADKKMMLLPLFECPPAAGQGAVVAETDPGNSDAVALLTAIEDKTLTAAVQQERETAFRYGFGCSQQFGTFYMATANTQFGYTSGLDERGNRFTEWQYNMPLQVTGKNIFLAADYMKDFFIYSYTNNVGTVNTKAIFVSSHKAMYNNELVQQCKQQAIWAAGTRTWFALAKKGLWVNGCADGLGLHFLLPIMESALFDVQQRDITVITNELSAAHWQQEGLYAIGSYGLTPTNDAAIITAISHADILFWTSFQQYEAYKHYTGKTVTHCCPAGKTATLLTQQGVHPVVFPTIKAFTHWKQSITP